MRDDTGFETWKVNQTHPNKCVQSESILKRTRKLQRYKKTYCPVILETHFVTKSK